MKLRVEFIARAISMLWAGFWLLFFVVESLAWHTPTGLMLMWVALGPLFVSLAVVAWRWGEQKVTDGNGSFSDGGKTYWFWFTTRNGHLGTGVRVTRTSDTQWAVEASADVGSTGTVVELTDGLATVVGYYNLTFHMIINKL